MIRIGLLREIKRFLYKKHSCLLGLDLPNAQECLFLLLPMEFVAPSGSSDHKMHRSISPKGEIPPASWIFLFPMEAALLGFHGNP